MIYLALFGCGDEERVAKDEQEEVIQLSMGCGIEQSALEAQLEIETTVGTRGYYLVVPDTYDANTPTRLIFGYAGTNWLGEQIRPYLGLEVFSAPNDIFVYPDLLWHDFEGWGNLGGWLLGPHAGPAEGMDDLEFTKELIDSLREQYCIDPQQIYATGHSWGGDMAQVVSCFLGDQFRATVPVAANSPYWFEPADNSELECNGSTAVWTMFGINDDHFTSQSYGGEYGDECRDFWVQKHNCEGVEAFVDLQIGESNECVEYENCDEVTRYCLYASEYGHQIPSGYFARETMAFFHSFE